MTINGFVFRRRFLGGLMSSRMQQDLAASLSHSFSTKNAAHASQSDTQERAQSARVCIVGAGVSGLRCADVLLKHGVEVHIFEARDRIGGRVHQEKVAGYTVDLGANWIHGATEDDPICIIARKVGAVLEDASDEQICFDPDGQLLPSAEALELTTAFFMQLEEASRYSAEHTATIPAKTSFFDFVSEKAVQLFPDERQRQLFLDISELWGSFIGGTIQTQSLKFLWLEQCLDGDNKFLASTYQKILKHIAEPALQRASLSLNTEVAKVKSLTEDGLVSGVEVHTVNGGVQVFDQVVVTVPLGILKRTKELFEPPLPERLSQAIDALGYGNLDKAYITFPEAFWASEPTHAQSNQSNLRTNSSPVPAENGDGLERLSSPTYPASHNPNFIHWDRPTYASSNPRKWNLEGVSLADLPESCAHPTLLFYFSDGCSNHISSLLQDHPQTSQEGQKMLIDFFQPYYSRLPNWDPASPRCKPIVVRASNWTGDRLAGYGSYSNFPVGLERGDEDITVIRKGMPERRIWLAGEHTAPFVALGTVTGAWWSGDAVAKRMLEGYSIPLKD